MELIGIKLNDFEDETSCQVYCRDRIDCKWYTYHSQRKYCTLMKTCLSINTDNCPDCVTSYVACAADGPFNPDLSSAKGCFSSGECKNSKLIDEWDATSIEECLLKCQDSSSCNYMTFFEDVSLCEGYENCIELSTNFCDNCFSAAKSCESK